jgi:NAD(P)-dependent dehydrogenase (short-subunit alcohol dehydrogenase family)
MSAAPAILVTGGASGIGCAVVEAILAEGWRAIAADVSERNLAAAREKLGERSGLLERVDVADEMAVVRAVAACENEFGPLAGVVNSAGIARDIPALETSAEVFRQVINVNLIGSFLVGREVAKAMRSRATGAIVNLASVSGIVGNQGPAPPMAPRRAA